jgi:hypothetical protein
MSLEVEFVELSEGLFVTQQLPIHTVMQVAVMVCQHLSQSQPEVRKSSFDIPFTNQLDAILLLPNDIWDSTSRANDNPIACLSI